MFYHLANIVCSDSEVDTSFYSKEITYYESTLCISNDDTIYSFGNSIKRIHGHNNQIIDIPKEIPDLINIKMIDCSSTHTICLNHNGDVFYFGSNITGIKEVRFPRPFFRYPQEENVLQKFTNSTQKINVPPCKQVSCGNMFSICLTEDNILYSLGNNTKGKLGLGDNKENYYSPQLIPDLNNIEYVVCGEYHVICKTYNNEFYSWGNNESGQLGQGNQQSCNKPIQCLNWPDNIINIKCGNKHSLLLTSEGQIYSFGDNSMDQLGINDETIKYRNIPTLINDISEIQRIECGYNHSLCIDINDNLWLFGDNSEGQLGLGHRNKIIQPIQSPILKNIIDISSRGQHSFVKTLDNKIYTFGRRRRVNYGYGNYCYKDNPIQQTLVDNEGIWRSTRVKSRVKSARK